MIFINDLKNMIMYKKKFYLPLHLKDKKLGNRVFLLTPNIDSSIKLLNYELMDPKYYSSYYLERNVLLYINSSGDYKMEPYTQSEDIEEAANMEIINEATDKQKEQLIIIFPKLMDKLLHTKFTLKVLEKRIPLIETEVEHLQFEYDYFKAVDKGEKVNIQRINKAKSISKKLISLVFGVNPVSVGMAIAGSIDDINDDLEDFEDELQLTLMNSKKALRYLKKEKRRLEAQENSGHKFKFFKEEFKYDDEDYGDHYLLEDAKHNAILKKYLYEDRLRTPKELFAIYDKIKESCPFIKKTFIDLKRYKSFNLFIDFYFYNELFFKNNTFKLNKGLDLYLDFMDRFLSDPRFSTNGYTLETKYIMVPVDSWFEATQNDTNDDFIMYNKELNPISIMYRLFRTDLERTKSMWKNCVFIFTGKGSYFKLEINSFEEKDVAKFKKFINKFADKNYNPDTDPEVEIDKIATGDPNSTSAVNTKGTLAFELKDTIETSRSIDLDHPRDEESAKDIARATEIIAQVADKNEDLETAADELDNNEEFTEILARLSNTQSMGGVQISTTRSKRIENLKVNYYDTEIDKVKIKDMIKENKKPATDLPPRKLKIDGINSEEWSKVSYTNFDKEYDVKAAILENMGSFADKSYPIVVRNVEIVDSSTSEDYIDTYIFDIEDMNGKRSKLKLDIPKIKDHRFLRLKGNDKTIQPQRMLLPIIKTDDDTVQIVSDYNKIFISRFGSKSDVNTDMIMKSLNKMETKGSDIKIVEGNVYNSNIHTELNYDYLALSKVYTSIETPKCKFIFSQKLLKEELQDKYKEGKYGFPIGINKKDKTAIYPNEDGNSSIIIDQELNNYMEYAKVREGLKPGTKYMYSRCSILNSKIPLIVVLAHGEGLTSILNKSNIEYEIFEKKPNINRNEYDLIRFNDGWLKYKLSMSSSILMNGLKECNTIDYSVGDINNKMMWINFLDIFGNKLLSDGLDNFYDCMINPKTADVLKDFKLPTTYTEVLLYANELLCDNKYVKHTDVTGTRFRTNEIISAYTYKVLSEAYGNYKTELKHNKRDAKMSIKQSAVCDAILTNSTTSDVTIINPILEIETENAITSKGLSGMNSERAYKIDKRGYDNSMLNSIGMSTGFAKNAGVTRQTTIDMNIDSKGYFKVEKDLNEMGVTKTLTMTEALTPFEVTRDDPIRVAMNFIQTADHQMRVKNSTPSLISNGADEALPYLIGNTFAFKSKMSGVVKELTDDYMIVSYKDGSNDFIDLRNSVQKNSAGGFYVTLKLSPQDGLKVGSKFGEDEILAYDETAFSSEVGATDNLAFNTGTLCKIAIINTDEGFEDSVKIDHFISEALTTQVVIPIQVTLGALDNIYNMVNKGDAIQEGDSLLVYQRGNEDEDISNLLRNITDEDVINDIGRKPIKSKVTGYVEDIKIYRTVDKSELSPSLLKAVNKFESEQKKLQAVALKYKTDYPNRFITDKLPPTGKLKNVEEGVLIEFYLRYDDKMSVGDKLTFLSALKGVTRDIYDIGTEPKSEYRPNENINALLSLASVNSRMVGSVITNSLINKGLIELTRQCKDILGIKYNYFNQ